MRALKVARVGLAYWWRHGRWPALGSPRRFTEWVQWRKLNDRNERRGRLTDKDHSKKDVAAALGDAFVIPTLWLGEVLPRVAPWPMPFIVKANHGCGQSVIVRTASDYALARELAPDWLRRSYGRWLDEWHYRSARRLILVEPLVGDGEVAPIDYKLFVFAGKAVMVQVHEGRGGDHRWSQYGINGAALSRQRAVTGLPKSLPEMVAAAERLGTDHDFLRVDFYEIGGRPLFGEYCLYPGSGLDRFDPDGLDEWLGAYWTAQQDGPSRKGSGAEAPALLPA